MSRELSLQGYILKSQDIGEQDVLLTFFSLEQGKVRVIVKSAKKLTSRLAGRIQPTSKLEITLAGNGSLPKLIGATVQEHFSDIMQSEDRIAALLVMQEYTNRALADAQPNEELFASYGRALGRLVNADTDTCLYIATSFVTETLLTIGLAPRILDTGVVESDLWLSFDDGRFVLQSGLGQQTKVEAGVYGLYKELSQNQHPELVDYSIWQKLLRILNDFTTYQLERQLRAAEYFFKPLP